ncbi:MAG: hypothetical protein ACJ8DC_17260 [Gemmatimonadales bacterium]
MSKQIGRAAWAGGKVRESWWEQVGVGVITAIAYYVEGMSQELAAIGVGVAAGLGWTLVRFGWHFSRARIVQERADSARLREMEEQAPRINVQPERAHLVVRNDGATASFWAQLRIVERHNFPSPIRESYDGFWEQSLGRRR